MQTVFTILTGDRLTASSFNDRIIFVMPCAARFAVPTDSPPVTVVVPCVAPAPSRYCYPRVLVDSDSLSFVSFLIEVVTPSPLKISLFPFSECHSSGALRCPSSFSLLLSSGPCGFRFSEFRFILIDVVTPSPLKISLFRFSECSRAFRFVLIKVAGPYPLKFPCSKNFLVRREKSLDRKTLIGKLNSLLLIYNRDT